jgi:acyl-[acyl-carrier-protein]-phospholipid O-acyltransferase / long-chain-fatty-acid--[acyl-carrier-protein] ligase
MLLHHQFLRSAKQFGSKTAIIDRTTGTRLSYTRALIGALVLADKFKAGDEGFVGIMLPTSAGCILSVLGALLSGRTPVMINYSTGAHENCRYAQQKCAFKTIITSKVLLQKIHCPVVPGMVFLEDLMRSVSVVDKVAAALRAKLPLALLQRGVHGGALDDIAVVLFTSGSERDPKAVPLTHRNLAANLEGISAAIALRADDIFLANLPLFHVFGLTTNLCLPLQHGMTIVTYANPLEFKTICEIIRTEQVTFVVGTPIFMWGYLRKSQAGDFASCRIMLTGADKTPDSLREEFREKHDIELLEGYGCTETSPVISVNFPGANRPGSVGRPLPNVRVRLEHHETGETCGVGEIGKILVQGDSVMGGYYDDFAATSLSMRRGWYDTGDMGYQDADGYLWHVGRLKRFMKIGGEMVSLIRVENALERCLPDDVSCCVVEIPDGVRGARIVAAVTRAIDEAEVTSALSRELPNIALPRQFVVMAELPTMGSGKIDFRRTTELVRDMVQRV